MASVQQVCTELLPDLDEDIFDYIVGALEEFQNDSDADNEETATMISSFLESAGYLEDEDQALAKAGELVARVSAGGAGEAPSGSDGPQKLSEAAKKMTIRMDEQLAGDDTNSNVNKNTLIEEKAVSEKESKLAKKRDDKAAKKQEKQKKYGKLSSAEQAEQQALEVDAELAEARKAAVQARSKLGAYKGALDAKAFTLPNPGGGQPLLEDAACRLVWGRRYGLIGRNGMVSRFRILSFSRDCFILYEHFLLTFQLVSSPANYVIHSKAHFLSHC